MKVESPKGNGLEAVKGIGSKPIVFLNDLDIDVRSSETVQCTSVLYYYGSSYPVFVSAYGCVAHFAFLHILPLLHRSFYVSRFCTKVIDRSSLESVECFDA